MFLKTIIFIFMFLSFLKTFPQSNNFSLRFAYELAISDDPFLYLALAKVESNFNPKAISSKGALGLYQIMPLWVPELKRKKILAKKEDLFHPLKNFRASQYILKKYQFQTGNLFDALRAYNCGINRAKKSKKCGTKYAERVLAYKKYYEQKFTRFLLTR